MEHLLSHGLCHERVVIRVRIYVPIAVDAYVLDADDLAVFRAQTSAATATEDTSLLSVRLSCRQLQGAATAAVVRCAVLRHRAPRAPRALVKTLSVQERVLFIERYHRGHL